MIAPPEQRQQSHASISGRLFAEPPHVRDHPYHRASPPAQTPPERSFQNPAFLQQSPHGRQSVQSMATVHTPTSKHTSSGPLKESSLSPRLSPHESLLRSANGDLWSRTLNSKPLEPPGSWHGDCVLDTRGGLSVAVQASELGHFGNPLTTAASFTDQQSTLESRKDGLLSTRNIYDVDGRYPLHTSPIPGLQRSESSHNQATNGWIESTPDVRKQIMDDSALEAEIHMENMAHHKSMGKHGGILHPFNREGLDTSPAELKLGGRSRNRCKPRLTKAQIEFVGKQPLVVGPQLVKKPAGIFHRQIASTGRSALRGNAAGISRLDARNDKAMDTHARVMAWLEQGERYMQEHTSPVYSPVHATLDVEPPSGITRCGKPLPYTRTTPPKKKQLQTGPISFFCCSAPCVKK